MPKLLDLFCGAGGAAMGYSRAGFEVVGVDLKEQPHFPFKFIQADVLSISPDFLRGFAAIHASPPCQAYSAATRPARHIGKQYPDLVALVRAILEASGKPYIIENVPGAPLKDPIRLCGTMFGLGVFRHRLFESNVQLGVPPHYPHKGHVGDGHYWSCYGNGDARQGNLTKWRPAMGINWMRRKEITQAIPPAYTEFLGRQLILAV